MRPLKERISITIDNDPVEKARRLAEGDDRSPSQFINIALREFIKKKEEKKQTGRGLSPSGLF